MIRRVPLAVVAVLVAVAGMILLLWLLGGLVPPVTAALSPSPAQRPLANGGVTRYVAITGTDSGPNDCTSSGNPCRTIQHAVNSADDGDDILVTEGVYSDTFAVEGHWQVVFIRDKTVTIRGGYSTDFSTWAPDTYVTTLDGQGAGTGVWMQAQVATGGMTPTLEAVRVTNGAINPGAGGGIYAAGSPNHPIHPVISGCHVYSNSASMAGGGIYLAQVTGAELTGNEVYENRAFGTHPWDHGGGGIAAREAGNIRLTGNRVYSNTAQQNGGGVYVNQSDDVILAGNEIFSNTTPMSSGHTGGGVTLRRSYSATLAGNLIYSNTAFFGGGVNLSDGSTATLTGNRIYGNQARQGGGIHSASSGGSTLAGNEILGNTATGGSGGIYIVFDSGTMLIGNRIQDNTATFDGGGLSINQSERVTLTNNWVTENRVGSGYHGAGLNVEGSSVSLLHNTIARGGTERGRTAWT
jgi:parallel beta-helix repeat protein